MAMTLQAGYSRYHHAVCLSPEKLLSKPGIPVPTLCGPIPCDRQDVVLTFLYQTRRNAFRIVEFKTELWTSAPPKQTPSEAGLSPKSASGGLSPTPQATSSAFIANFPDNPKKICIKDPAAPGAAKHHGEIYFSFDRVFWTECSQEEIFQVNEPAAAAVAAYEQRFLSGHQVSLQLVV